MYKRTQLPLDYQDVPDLRGAEPRAAGRGAQGPPQVFPVAFHLRQVTNPPPPLQHHLPSSYSTICPTAPFAIEPTLSDVIFIVLTQTGACFVLQIRGADAKRREIHRADTNRRDFSLQIRGADAKRRAIHRERRVSGHPAGHARRYDRFQHSGFELRGVLRLQENAPP